MYILVQANVIDTVHMLVLYYYECFKQVGVNTGKVTRLLYYPNSQINMQLGHNKLVGYMYNYVCIIV